MADRPRNRPTPRPHDEQETAATLALFNTRLAQQAEQEQRQRRVDKATRLKDQAAARVRALESDNAATAAERDEAVAEYRSAVAALASAREGDDHGDVDTAAAPDH